MLAPGQSFDRVSIPASARPAPSNIFNVIYIGLSFTILFTAYHSAEDMVNQIYKQLHYDKLGQICVFTIYLFMGLGSIFSSHIKRGLSHRVGLTLGASGYVSFLSVGCLTTWCGLYDTGEFMCTTGLIYTLNVITASFVGIGASLLWLSQADYTNQCASPSTKSRYNGIFWALFQLSQLIGTGMSTLVLRYTNQFIFYLILLGFAFASLILFSFLPHVHKHEGQPVEEAQLEPFSQSVSKFGRALIHKKALPLNFLMFMTGVVLAFNAGYLNIIANNIATVNYAEDHIPPEIPDNIANEKVSIVFIGLAVGEVSSGLLISLVGDAMNKVLLLNLVVLIPELAMILAVVAYGTSSYPLMIFVGFLAGASDASLNTAIGSTIGAHFGGALEMFSVVRFLLGFATMYGSIVAIFVEERVYLYTAITFGAVLILQTMFVLTGQRITSEAIEFPGSGKALYSEDEFKYQAHVDESKYQPVYDSGYQNLTQNQY